MMRTCTDADGNEIVGRKNVYERKIRTTVVWYGLECQHFKHCVPVYNTFLMIQTAYI